MNNIFDFCSKLIDRYRSFSSSFAHPRAKDISATIQAADDNRRFWPDALIQINPNYKRGKNIQELADNGDVLQECANIFQVGKKDDPPNPQPITLYQHQMDALSMVAGNKSYVVTTGTGSGKSLAFFIPIINRILQQKKHDSRPRIRAIIVYPMNALANSQLEEIHKFLDGSTAIRVARYTGQEKDDERKEIKATPPDILLTNYVMLDLILTRYQQDHAILLAAQQLEFLVLDELHTYRGRQGADVAMLVRRLRNQLHADNLLCIGTSATMASIGSEEDRRTAVSNVTSKLFDTCIPPENVIMEVLEYATVKMTAAGFKQKLPARLQQRGVVWHSVEDFRNDPLAVWAEQHLGITVNAQDNKTLERAQPMTLKDAAKTLADDAGVNAAEAEEALKDFLLSLYMKRDWPDKQPPFAFKLHQFISGPGQIMTTLEPEGKRAVELDAQRFAPGGQKTNRFLFPTYFCRFCGQEYMPVWLKSSSGKITVEPRDIREESPTEEPEDDTTVRSGFLCPADSLGNDSVFKAAFDGFQEDLYEYLPDSWFETNRRGDRVPGASYRKRIPEPIYAAADGAAGTMGTPFWFMPGKHTYCLHCGQFYDSSSGRDSNRLVSLSGEGRSSATTVLTFEALELMYQEATGTSANKLLGFTDNRQDAALQAGHFNQFIFMVMLRSALLRALTQSSPGAINADEIAAKVFQALGFDSSDATVLADYLVNPHLRGLQLAKAQEALRFMLGYRLFEDLGTEWRFNNPNLEQLRLLTIDYVDLDSLAADEALLVDSPLLLSLSVAKRRQFAKIIFDFMRRSYCVQTKYFEVLEQERQRIAGANTLLEDWQMPASDGESLAFSRSLVIYQKPDPDLQQNKSCIAAAEQLQHKAAVSGSYLSKFFRLLVHGTTDDGHSLWEGTPYTGPDNQRDYHKTNESKPELLRAAIVMLRAASNYGIVKNNSIGTNDLQHAPVESCILNESAIIWAFLPETARAGEPTRADSSISNDFFKTLYQQVASQLGSPDAGVYGYEAQEHTAQVDGEIREALEMRFRDGDKDRMAYRERFPESRYQRLPILYCSPTMELGVDISTLDMVYLRNVPPTPANYAQRSGRAGRSGQAALVVTYCAALSPHDQWFFGPDHILDMVHGEVCVPSLDLTNQDLVESHLRAVWMSCIEADIPVCIKELLDMEQKDTLPLKPEIAAALNDPTAAAKAVTKLKQIMQKLKEKEYAGNLPSWCADGFAENVVRDAPKQFAAALNRWRTLYQSTGAQADRAHQLSTSPNITKEERQRASAMHQDAVRQLNELSGGRTANQDFYLYRYLASEGVLPGYSFPRLPITAWIQKGNAAKRNLTTTEDSQGALISRPRFLALSEFGPLSLIYHEGHTFTVHRVKLRASDANNHGHVGTTSARICPTCGRGHFGEENGPGVTNCVECNEPLASVSVMHNLYQVQAVEARPAARISLKDEERQRMGYDIVSTYGFEHSPVKVNLLAKDKVLLQLQYSTAAKIERINRGWRRRKNQEDYGFWMNPANGDWLGEADLTKKRKKNIPDPIKIVPYVQDHRNALVLTPQEDLDLASGALCTLVAALLRGLEHVFQLEPGEIAAEPIPDMTNAHSILFYEATEGGAGVLGQLVSSAQRAQLIACIATRALEVMHYHSGKDTESWEENASHCEAGCYKCLLSYFNQPQHAIIDRRNPQVLALLQTLTKVTQDNFLTPTMPAGATGQQQLLLNLLQAHRYALPDAPPKSFAAANIQADAWYKAARTALFFTAPSDDVRGVCAEKGIAVLLLPSAEADALLQFFADHPDIFGKLAQ